MNNKERREIIEQGKTPDHIPVSRIYPWAEATERWIKEGLPEGEDVNLYLGLDTDDDTYKLPIDMGFNPLFEVEVLDIGNKYVTVIDEYGVTKKMFRTDYDRSNGNITSAGKMSSMSEWINFPVVDYSSWEKIKAERFFTDYKRRVPPNWIDELANVNLIKNDRRMLVENFPILGSFGGLRQLMGLENLIFTMYDNPGLIKKIFEDLTQIWMKILTEAFADVKIDHIIFFEDMCGTNAPIISPECFLEFFGDAYTDFIHFIKENGVKTIDLDSDGNAWKLIPSFIKIGINEFSPCQASANMDIEKLRDAFSDLCLRGGIDKTCLIGSKQEIEQEVKRKYKLAWNKGRYLPQIDHCVPPDVSWDNIRYFAEYCKKYSAKPY